ncbi:hypothetical protein KUTeg_011528 [Tegillarca granosa]|uniref:Uncharacterized protein n=1 Tax=Tegillarca granosa TaxID=220873 RepID=A0ABQ9EWZ3_TEGGR|nr:hypothetical protein KUTeg_011528 [Tegillarca granosa]
MAVPFMALSMRTLYLWTIQSDVIGDYPCSHQNRFFKFKTLKHRKLEQRLHRAVERLEKYWTLLKTNGLLPKGDKKLRKENYLDLSVATDESQSQEEGKIHIRKGGCVSVSDSEGR